MILKAFDEIKCSWLYIDKIKSVQADYGYITVGDKAPPKERDGEECYWDRTLLELNNGKCVGVDLYLLFDDGTDSLIVVPYHQAFLLNDEGKTIERI